MRKTNHFKVGDILEGSYAGPTQILLTKRLKKHKQKNRQIWECMALNGKYFGGQTGQFSQKTLELRTQKILRNDKMLLNLYGTSYI